MPHTKQIWRTWGARLRAQIKAKGLTLAIVAERLGRSEPTLRSWTNGHRQINLSDFFDLCEAAGLDSAIVLFGHDLFSPDQKQGNYILESHGN